MGAPPSAKGVSRDTLESRVAVRQSGGTPLYPRRIMRYLVAVLLSFCALAAVAPAPASAQNGAVVASADLLVGTWEADFSAILQDDKMSEEERQLALVLLGDASMTLSVHADGSLTLSGQIFEDMTHTTGTWGLNSANGNVLHITTTTRETGATGDVTESMTVTFSSPDAMVLADDVESIPFVRR